MPTPVSSATAYATGADLVLSRDWRQIADLIQDDDTRATEASVPTHPVVLAALNWASGKIESACSVGKRYTVADLQALNGVSRDYLRSLVCDLAFLWLKKRRHPDLDPRSIPWASETLEDLEKLRTGQAIFMLQEVQDAGLTQVVDLARPGSAEDNSRITRQAIRFFGR